MKKKIPIVFIHKWSHSYLDIAISQVKKKNNYVVLIGDKNNHHIADKNKIDHFAFDDLYDNLFTNIYKHNKDSHYWYELFCYQRWFVLLEFMKRNNISQCLYLDSDILYYPNINQEFERISNFWSYKLAYPQFSGHTTYVFSQQALRNFSDFMTLCYSNDEMYKKLLSYPLKYQHGISDMSIFQLYYDMYPDYIFDLTADYWDHIVYDWFINIDEWYQTYCNKKDFNFVDNYPTVKTIWWSQVTMMTIHFQMHMKNYMWRVYQKKMWIYHFLLIVNSFIERCYYHIPWIKQLRNIQKSFSLFK